MKIRGHLLNAEPREREPGKKILPKNVTFDTAELYSVFLNFEPDSRVGSARLSLDEHGNIIAACTLSDFYWTDEWKKLYPVLAIGVQGSFASLGEDGWSGKVISLALAPTNDDETIEPWEVVE